MKQEPEETEIKRSEAIFKPPPLPEPEVLSDLLHKWSLSKSDQLFFMQLPDSLPGQPPTKEHRPVKTEVQSEDGQSVLLKTENQVDIKSFEITSICTIVYQLFLIIRFMYIKKAFCVSSSNLLFFQDLHAVCLYFPTGRAS